MSVASYGKTKFKENILFTHKGLSGPSILQISSYLKSFSDETITINLLPDLDLKEIFLNAKNSKQTIANFLKTYLPNRFIDAIAERDEQLSHTLSDTKKVTLNHMADALHAFTIPIDGSEGYLKAEVTVGGVDTNELSSKTMMSHKVPELYFIGEVVDVTGWLGGYNFQWAWSSGYVSGQNVLKKTD
jgi:predicted Rossmann fold flavoprotein